ncbi:MAG: chemotaxis protein CheB [Zavarzinella sp.]
MRVAIVDDLSLGRDVLKRAVSSMNGCSLAWMASDGNTAMRMLQTDPPDVILLELMLAGVDGIELVKKIKLQSHAIVLIVTSSLSSNFQKVTEALAAGAQDAVNRPRLSPTGELVDTDGLKQRLQKIAITGKPAETVLLTNTPPFGNAFGKRFPGHPPLLAIGASTGGPQALQTILRNLPPLLGMPVVVALHIAPDFVHSLVETLRSVSVLPVTLAESGKPVEPNVVYVAHSDEHLNVDANGRFYYSPQPKDYAYRPSINELFTSLATNWTGLGIGVLLTGMGRDGADGLLKLRKAGWHTITQDKTSSVVYGMPQAAAEIQAAREILALNDIPLAIQSARTRLIPASNSSQG